MYIQSILIFDTMYLLWERPNTSDARVVKWGNSLAIRIPKAVAKEAKFREGDMLVIEVVDGQVKLRHAEAVPTLQELVAQITPENRYAEMSSGRETGRKMVEW
jgi:antitoxin MazE